MSYTPTEWTTGDVVTAQKLNKIETGIAENSSGGGTSSGGILLVHTLDYDSDYGTYSRVDYSKSELIQAVKNGFYPVLIIGEYYSNTQNQVANVYSSFSTNGNGTFHFYSSFTYDSGSNKRTRVSIDEDKTVSILVTT